MFVSSSEPPARDVAARTAAGAPSARVGQRERVADLGREVVRRRLRVGHAAAQIGAREGDERVAFELGQDP